MTFRAAAMMTHADEMTPRDFWEIAWSHGYQGNPLAYVARDLGLAAGIGMTPATRRAALDGWRDGGYARDMDDSNPADFGGAGDDSIPW